MKTVRYVRICGDGPMNSWDVNYVHRQPRQRYKAASFYKPDVSYQQVVDWVNKQSNLKLEQPETK
jgi:hypothetical protein